LRGLVGGNKVVETGIVSAISCVIDPFANYEAFLELAKSESLRLVVSNTTEAGITYDETDKLENTPATTYPGKLTQLLLARFNHFGGEAVRGLIVLPVELIDQNGTKLLECVLKLITLWKLPEDFAVWVQDACIFCNCLVDRIVSGYPADEAQTIENELLGYKDELMVVGEPYALWVIESKRLDEVRAAFALDKAGLPVVFTEDLRPYRERKVRVLNGAHTTMALAAYLAGLDTVGQAMADADTRYLVEKAVFAEICPTVPLPPEEVRAFASSVMERFENPFIKHKLLGIALNSVSKWRARILPSLKDSLAATGKLPPCLCFGLAALAAFYRSSGKLERGEGCLIGLRGGETYEIRDDAFVLELFASRTACSAPELVRALLGSTACFGEDLNEIPGLTEAVTAHLENIERDGVRAAIRSGLLS
jgi:tagaturonate reductase